MPNRITHNNVVAFVGPAPATGYHYMNYNGEKINPVGAPTGSYYNLVHPLLRIQSFSYNANIIRPNATFLGSESIIVDDITDQNFNIDLSYLQHGIINELRMGFYANYYESGNTVYGHFDKPAISGFINRSMAKTNIAPISNSIQNHSPFDYRDCRNIFIVVDKDEGQDLVESYDQLTSDTSNKVTYGFGNAYITSYTSSASVGAFPECSVSYTADNMEMYGSPTYQTIPALDPSTGNNPNIEFSLPTFSESNTNYEYISSVVKPSDINIRIAEVNNLSSKKAIAGTGNLPTSYSNAMSTAVTSLNVQSYNLSVNFNRKNLSRVGYKIPQDRVIESPILVDFSFEIIDDENLFNFMQERYDSNKEFYISVTLNNATGDFVDVQYDLLRVKCTNFGTDHSISQNSLKKFSFQGDINPYDNTKGFFISGNKNIYKRNYEF